MTKALLIASSILSAITVLAFAGCRSASGPADDAARASTLWERIAGYRNWGSYPGMNGFQEGTRPHGKWVKSYLNSVAARDATAAGAIIIAENYEARDETALGPVTVMEKLPGYDPAHGDWFWAKFSADGRVLDDGVGALGAAGPARRTAQGCIRCHGRASGGDYLFVNDI